MPDDRHEDAEAEAWAEDEANRTSVSVGVADRVTKAEEKMIPAFGKKRRRLVDWPTKRRFR